MWASEGQHRTRAQPQALGSVSLDENAGALPPSICVTLDKLLDLCELSVPICEMWVRMGPTT